jgi:hypothetical protein
MVQDSGQLRKEGQYPLSMLPEEYDLKVTCLERLAPQCQGKQKTKQIYSLQNLFIVPQNRDGA